MICLPIRKLFHKCFDSGIFILFLGVFVYFISVNLVWAGEIVALINKDTGVTEMSYRELKKIFKGEKKFWDNGKNIVFFIPPPGSAAKEALVTKVFRVRSRAEVSKFYLTAIFRQIFSVPPTSYKDLQDAVFRISRVDGGITLVDSDGLKPSDSVKIIHLDM